MKYLPNILTFTRILLVPLFPLFYYSNNTKGTLIALSIYILAGLTDILDGFIARKYNLITKLGIVLDPLADKLMLLSVLFTLTLARIIPWFIVITIAIKEIFMIITAIILYFKKDKSVIASNVFGKTSSALFFVAIVETILFNIYYLNIFLFFVAFTIKLIALYTYILSFKKIQNNLNNRI